MTYPSDSPPACFYTAPLPHKYNECIVVSEPTSKNKGPSSVLSSDLRRHVILTMRMIPGSSARDSKVSQIGPNNLFFFFGLLHTCILCLTLTPQQPSTHIADSSALLSIWLYYLDTSLLSLRKCHCILTDSVDVYPQTSPKGRSCRLHPCLFYYGPERCTSFKRTASDFVSTYHRQDFHCKVCHVPCHVHGSFS